MPSVLIYVTSVAVPLGYVVLYLHGTSPFCTGCFWGATLKEAFDSMVRSESRGCALVLGDRDGPRARTAECWEATEN